MTADVTVRCCLSLCLLIVTHWEHFQAVTCLLPCDGWKRHKNIVTENSKGTLKIDGWTQLYNKSHFWHIYT